MRYEDNCKVVIIGGGIAGIFTALQLKRYKINSIIIEKSSPGGLLSNANNIENFPGFPGGINGGNLSQLILKQTEEYELQIIKDEVLEINFDGNFFIKGKKNNYTSDFCVIATGTVAKLPYPEILESNKVFTEVSFMPELIDNTIAILGSGDIAFDYALTLAKKNKVKILSRTDIYNALPLLIDRVKSNANIEIIPGFNLISTREVSEKIEILSQDNKITVDYFLLAIGRLPADKLYKELDLNNENLFIAGDCRNGIFRQATIAAADGIRTAMELYFKIKKNENTKENISF